jgi:hypothetical protein
MNPTLNIDAAIRTIFRGRRSFEFGEAAQLLGMRPVALARLLSESEIEDGDDGRLAWGEVAYLAMGRWPIETIFSALGDEASRVLPPMLRPTSLSAMLPAYQVRMIEVAAAREGIEVGTFLLLHLLDLASACDLASMEREIPGFVEALQFPSRSEEEW